MVPKRVLHASNVGCSATAAKSTRYGAWFIARLLSGTRL